MWYMYVCVCVVYMCVCFYLYVSVCIYVCGVYVYISVCVSVYVLLCIRPMTMYILGKQSTTEFHSFPINTLIFVLGFCSFILTNDNYVTLVAFPG